MISERARKNLKYDATKLYGVWTDFEKPTTGFFDFGIGNVDNIPDLKKIYLKLFNIRTVVELAKTIINSFSRYPGTQGYLPLREGLAELVNKESGLEVDSERIVVTNGTADALTHAMFLYADGGQKVMFSVPSYPYWPNAARSECGFTTFPAMNGDEFVYGFEKADKKDVAALIVNSPHNPTGMIIIKEHAKRINELALENGILIILDDVYRSFSNRNVTSEYTNPVIVDSLSKRFAVPGMRCGFAVLPFEEDAKVFRAAVGNQSIGPSNVVQFFASKILELNKKYDISKIIDYEIQRRQQLLDDAIQPLFELGIKSDRPTASMYRMLDLTDFSRRTGICSAELEEILKCNGVIARSASCFYPDPPEKEVIRICVGVEGRVAEGARKLVEVVEKVYNDKIYKD